MFIIITAAPNIWFVFHRCYYYGGGCNANNLAYLINCFSWCFYSYRFVKLSLHGNKHLWPWFSRTCARPTVTFILPLLSFQLKAHASCTWLFGYVFLGCIDFHWTQNREKERKRESLARWDSTWRLASLLCQYLKGATDISFSHFCSFSLTLSLFVTLHVNVVTSIALGNSQDWRHLFIEECPMPDIKKNRYLRKSCAARRYRLWLLHTQNASQKKMETQQNIPGFPVMFLMNLMKNRRIVLTYWKVLCTHWC